MCKKCKHLWLIDACNRWCLKCNEGYCGTGSYEPPPTIVVAFREIYKKLEDFDKRRKICSECKIIHDKEIEDDQSSQNSQNET